MRAHVKASGTTQSCRTATSSCTAKSMPHGNVTAHGKHHSARQSTCRTAKAFAV
jgi:hypothetical protein